MRKILLAVPGHPPQAAKYGMTHSAAMARPAHTRTVKARRLGRYLRDLRENYGVNINQVASDIGVSHMTIRRVEQGLHQTDISVLEKLFDRYELAYERRMELLELAGEAFRSGWWLEYGDVFDDIFAVMEDEASQILTFQALTVPGILQTDDYALALFETTPASHRMQIHKQAAIEKRLRVRQGRRAILDRPNPPHLHAVVGEAALRQEIGAESGNGEAVMREQLAHIAELATRDTVTVQVVPFSAGAHAGHEGSFMIFEFAHPDDADVVHTENLGGSVYSEKRGAVELFRMAWGSVISAALTPHQSADLISALAKER